MEWSIDSLPFFFYSLLLPFIRYNIEYMDICLSTCLLYVMVFYVDRR